MRRCLNSFISRCKLISFIQKHKKKHVVYVVVSGWSIIIIIILFGLHVKNREPKFEYGSPPLHFFFQ